MSSFAEILEPRTLMSVTAVFATEALCVNGDGGKNDLCIELFRKEGVDRYRVKEKGQAVKIRLGDGPQKVGSIRAADVAEIYLAGGGDDDRLTMAGTSSSGYYAPASLQGQAGNDTIRPGNGRDLVIGGGGNDTVDYSRYHDGVEIYLDTDAADASGRRGSTTDRDTLSGIENARGGDGNDVIYGNAADNKLDGGEGDDDLVGGAGADKLKGGDGNDTFQLLELVVDSKDEADGGDGVDWVYKPGKKDVLQNCEVVEVMP